MTTDSAIHIVIAYETDGIAVRAKEMVEGIAAEMQSECSSWEMESLGKPGLQREAVAAAIEADLIIIAARGAGKLPSPTRAWIETWLPQKKRGPAALVVLLDEEGEWLCKPPPFCVYLRQVAERGNMNFLCNTSHWTLRDFSSASELVPLHNSRNHAAPARYEPIEVGYGIND
jgi:hypothetical protein